MPEIDEVTWTKTISEPHVQEGMAAPHLRADLVGDWEGYQCRITPMNWKRGMYQALVSGDPGKHCPRLQNSYMTAETALRWCLEAMEKLSDEEEGRAAHVDRVRVFWQEVSEEGMERIGRMVGLAGAGAEGGDQK